MYLSLTVAVYYSPFPSREGGRGVRFHTAAPVTNISPFPSASPANTAPTAM